MKNLTKSYLIIIGAILAGIATGYSQLEFLNKSAEAIASLFMNFLQLIAVPIVFLSIVSTISGMKGVDEMKTLGRKVFSYTLLTTIIASAVALSLFLIINPIPTSIATAQIDPIPSQSGSYLSFLINIVPSNIVQAFLENNVIAIAFVAFLIGIAALKIPEENNKMLHLIFNSLFKVVLKMTELVIILMPIGIWAFTALLVIELRQNMSHFHSLMLYLFCILGANLIQGFVVLPLLLKMKGISPWWTVKGSLKPLTLAFFSKSSNATLPVTLQSAQNHLEISPRVANFSLPLCTVINMNGCAAFILTTVLFVAGINGHIFSPFDLGLWIVLATIAAIGNAGVPMGCFFLSSAFLIAMDVPVTMMGLILPFYAFLDMVETSLNVWSDICVTSIVDKELKSEGMEVCAEALNFTH